MGLKLKDLQARAIKRRHWSRNACAAREAKRQQRLATAEERMRQEIREAEDWAKRHPPPKTVPSARIRIEIPGLPTKTFTLRRWPDGGVLVGNRFTTAKAFGRKLGMLLDQFL